MRRAWFSFAVFCAFVALLARPNPSQDWNGAWKLNPTKSSYQGQVFTISISAEDEYRYDFGSSTFALRCDGKERPIGKNRTQSCVQRSYITLDLTREENGVKTRTTHEELSTDGKVLTSTVTEFEPNGSTNTHQISFARLSGSDGFAGRWRDTTYLQQHADMTLRLDNQALHIDYPGVGQQIDASLDGVEAAVRGPHVLEDTTFAVQPAGKREFLTITRDNGKITNKGSLKLSNDGKVIINTWWNPERPNVKATLVYEKK